MNESHQNPPSEVDRRIAEAAHDLARRRLSEIGKEASKEKSLETMVSALEHGGEDFSKEDVENFRLGRKDLIEAPKAMYIEGYLKEVERVSKDRNNVLQQRCAETMSRFSYRLR